MPVPAPTSSGTLIEFGVSPKTWWAVYDERKSPALADDRVQPMWSVPLPVSPTPPMKIVLARLVDEEVLGHAGLVAARARRVEFGHADAVRPEQG